MSTCLFCTCSTRGVEEKAHIIQKSILKTLDFDVEYDDKYNRIKLCPNCHRIFDKKHKYGKGSGQINKDPNDEKSFLNFLIFPYNEAWNKKPFKKVINFNKYCKRIKKYYNNNESEYLTLQLVNHKKEGVQTRNSIQREQLMIKNYEFKVEYLETHYLCFLYYKRYGSIKIVKSYYRYIESKQHYELKNQQCKELESKLNIVKKKWKDAIIKEKQAAEEKSLYFNQKKKLLKEVTVLKNEVKACNEEMKNCKEGVEAEFEKLSPTLNNNNLKKRQKRTHKFIKNQFKKK